MNYSNAKIQDVTLVIVICSLELFKTSSGGYLTTRKITRFLGKVYEERNYELFLKKSFTS